MRTLITDKSASGFSLVITVSLMVLLAVIATGLLSLSVLEIRSSEATQSQAVARANARMAMMIALGEIQMHLGPDQRVSAPAAQLDSDASSQKIDEVEQPHWVNVFRTTLEDGRPFVQRDKEDGGLFDLRAEESTGNGGAQVACLVSGNEGELLYSEVDGGNLSNVPMIPMVAAGSASLVAASKATVEAPLIEIFAANNDLLPGEGDKEKPSGHYAWWVGDLGTRANISTPDPFEEQSNDLAKKRRLQLAQDASLLAGNGKKESTNEERSRFVTPAQVALFEQDQGGIKTHFHDFTTESRGLLVNTREGGLKKDLTAFLLSSGSIPDLDKEHFSNLGLTDTDNLVGPRNDVEESLSANPGQAERLKSISPTFALLREWFHRSNSNPEGTLTANSETGETRGAIPAQRSFYELNKTPVKFENRRSNDVSPVVTESALYYNVSYFDTGLPFPRAHHLRLHLYPRVALWNPYNFKLEVPPSMIQLFINGGKQIEVAYDPPYEIRVPSRFGPDQLIPIDRVRYDMWWGDAGGATRGRLFFAMEPVTLEPGETVLFSPARNQVYNNEVYSGNTLSPTISPDPTRSFYVEKRDDSRFLFNVAVAAATSTPVFINDHLIAPPSGWREFVDPRPLGNIQQAQFTQADDYFTYWKPITGAVSGRMTADRFASLPHGQFVSCAFQYGDEDELPLEWNESTNVPLVRSSETGVVTAIPDRRTRDGFRLRWFDEHLSNRLGGGQLAGTAHMESALIANWNLRSSYAFRSPHDNVSDVPPHFFSAYTRDLFDENISWFSMAPLPREGKYRSDPFQAPGSGSPPRILFDAPRRETKIVSLGAFQHAKFSELIWSPTYPFGNSLVDPRVPLDRTEPPANEANNEEEGGWNKDTIGYTNDGRSSNNDGGASNQDNWAYTARGYLEDFVLENNITFDLSYELNQSLWDSFFLSTGTEREKRDFAENSSTFPLPNARLRLAKKSFQTLSDILDYHRAASVLAVDGAFNVNSTSVTAWESLLLSTLGAGAEEDTVTFPRILDLEGASWDGDDAESEEAWSGQRSLSRGEILELANSIVIEVKNRGPFLSLSDFVNRRLADNPTGLKGALQAAIDRTSINRSFVERYPLDNTKSLPNYRHPDNIRDPTRLEQTHKPDTIAWGALGFLTQADLLQVIGHTLTARSDTFVIRAYGNATDKVGKVISEAWCEATVQRTSEPVFPDKHGLNPDPDTDVDFGRKFTITRFRWLKKAEV